MLGRTTDERWVRWLRTLDLGARLEETEGLAARRAPALAVCVLIVACVDGGSGSKEGGGKEGRGREEGNGEGEKSRP